MALIPANIVYFESAAGFRRWLRSNHAKAPELWVGYWKRGTGKPTLTWPESVDEALTVGWIDGIRKRVDDERYTIRFTPRRPGSIWSAVNLRRVPELIAAGRMRPAGLAAFENRREDEARYSHEQNGSKLDRQYEKQFRAHAEAWKFYSDQPPGYRRTSAWWVMSAKREETRRRRLGQLIEHSAAGRPIPQLERKGK